MAGWTGVTIDPRTWVAGVKANIQAWLSFHITDAVVFAGVWDKVGAGVDVFVAHPQEKPATQLAKPRIVITKTGDTVQRILNSPQGDDASGDLEKHELTFRFDCLTDDFTGGAMANSALSGAVAYVFAKYQRELDDLGIMTLQLGGGTESHQEGDAPGTGLYLTSMDMTCYYYLQCAALRTLVRNLGNATVLNPGEVAFAGGVTLTYPAALRLRMVTGNRAHAVNVTVTATKGDYSSSTLAGTIQPSVSAGTAITLTPAQIGDKFVTVSGISIGAGEGVAGVAWQVENISEAL